MKKISPNNLSGARTYFTGFDNKSYINGNLSQQSIVLERTLKTLLLTKNKILFGASHLKSNTAFHFIEKNPEIFSSGFISPALSNKHNGALENAIGTHSKDKVDLYNSIFPEYIEWNLKDNTNWYRIKLRESFTTDNSLLMNSFKYTSITNIKRIIEIIDDTDLLNREYTKKIELYIDKRDIQVFKKFKNLLYNVSGAKAVNCESALDQENMIYDYSEKDIESKNIFLSEIEIFNRLFIEQVFTSLDRLSPSTNLIDSLNFGEVLSIRKILNNSDFILEYNKLITLSSKIIEQKEYIDFYSLLELTKISDELHSNFKVKIEEQIPFYIKKENRDQDNKIFFDSSFGLIKSLSGLSNPFLSSVIGGLDAGTNLIHLLKNKYNMIANRNDNKAREEYHDRKNKLLTNILENSYIDNRSSMIDVLKILQHYNNSKQQI